MCIRLIHELCFLPCSADVQQRELLTEPTTWYPSDDITTTTSATYQRHDDEGSRTSPWLLQLQYRVVANNLALLELADLRQRQLELINDVRNTFRRRRTHTTQDINKMNSEELCFCNTSQSLISSFDCLPPLNKSFQSRTLSRSLEDQYRLPVSVSGLTACYPSALHAILAQYSDSGLVRASSTLSDISNDELTSIRRKMSPPGTRTEVCDGFTNSKPEMKTADVSSPLQSTSTFGVEQRCGLDRRLVDIRRSTSAASVSSSEGYCSGTESDSVVDVSFQESIISGHDLSNGDNFARQSIEDDHVTTAAAVTRLMSTMTADKLSGATWRMASNKGMKPRRRLCKTNRRLSPLASTDEDEVFVTISSFDKFKTTRLNAITHRVSTRPESTLCDSILA